ncbi:hypothetical protein FVE85_5660 [Porphyridium purpureum]|uniref:Calcineurin-like phosphoesterase domain-containing protein n=1 Tax=Porphyridium purpureum TaxID=35688 RepID=A0A5J4Z428_PORPP|nr:hypothetical protein FVE85_5660 [Porphyridium purpureum]|eukprot:POR3483..scf295_1
MATASPKGTAVVAVRGNSRTALTMAASVMDSGQVMRIVCVGDVHDDWTSKDHVCVKVLAPDVLLFVGDFGNENVPVVEKILSLPEEIEDAPQVALVFGNHDAFFTASKYGPMATPSKNRNVGANVEKMIKIADKVNASYAALEVRDAPIPLHVVGGRPWSWGGPEWRHQYFFRRYAGVMSLQQSTSRIQKAIDQAGTRGAVVLLAHAGPTGLGTEPSAMCGRDFGDQTGGDWGDADLRMAIQHARAKDIRVPLCVFGHMHDRLQSSTARRTMIGAERDIHTIGKDKADLYAESLAVTPSGQDHLEISEDSGAMTVMLNCAVVPRVQPAPSSTNEKLNTIHHFAHVVMVSNRVGCVHEVWVNSSLGCVETVRLMLANKAVMPMEDVALETARLKGLSADSLTALKSSEARSSSTAGFKLPKMISSLKKPKI